MKRIETYVFLDLETTGFPSQELNKTKITELSMVSISRQQMEGTAGTFPQLLSKFTKCFNPERPVAPGSADITGLCNFLLENETTFNENVCNTINSYLDLFQKPVCLLAHNGHGFDFPILKKHFEKLNCSLSSDVLCADSLYAFYDILRKDGSVNEQSCNTEGSSRKRVLDTENESSNDGPDSKQMAIENTLNALDDDNPLAGLTQEFLENDVKPLTMQEQNERTPQKRTNNPPPVKRKNIVRKIFYENHKKPDKSYQLEAVYERVLGRPAKDAHRAESDCVMAVEIAIRLGQRFVDWVAENQVPFAEVKAMKRGL
ncbi:unnamed protein product [Chrysodeixis includens]|uniref:Exonuclease domain-containing protein n=1 Tax=Chrysodeixis includens TaxID=689277 RepID=A0A9P0BTK1_CHRIL|nr:unnamed protein product [Chrysodeixis includens]